MKKRVVFKNALFYNLLISVIVLLVLYNIYSFIKTANALAFVPIIIQSLLLVLIFLKHQSAKIAIIIWASIVLIIGSGLEIITAVMDISNGLIDGFNSIPVDSYIFNLIDIVIGVLIISYTRRTVQVVSVEQEPEEVR
jgi:hypothetical protein